MEEGEDLWDVREGVGRCKAKDGKLAEGGVVQIQPLGNLRVIVREEKKSECQSKYN